MDNAAGPSDGMMTALLVRNDNAQERLAVLKARRSEIRKQQAAVNKEIKNGLKRRARLASRLRGFADDDVLGMLGLRALGQANAAAAPKARAKAKAKP